MRYIAFTVQNPENPDPVTALLHLIKHKVIIFNYSPAVFWILFILAINKWHALDISTEILKTFPEFPLRGRAKLRQVIVNFLKIVPCQF